MRHLFHEALSRLRPTGEPGGLGLDRAKGKRYNLKRKTFKEELTADNPRGFGTRTRRINKDII
jgi:hypothetical protein